MLAAPRSSRSQDPSALLRHRPGPTASWPAQQAEWDPGPGGRQEDDAVDRAWTATPVDSAAESGGREAGRQLDETADRDPGTETSEDDDVGEKGEGQAVQDDDDDDDGQQPGEQRALDIPLTAGDSEATASEMLPVPAPLSMGGRGPPMTLSLEDMDYLTILRPPQPPRRAGGAKHNKRKSNNNSNKNTKAGVKHATKTKPGGGKGRPKAPPQQPPAASTSYGPPPPPPAAPPPDSYAGFLGYDAPPPYGYGFGPYPRYPDPVMTLEYQQATSYPEEERFRPLPPLKGPAPMAPAPMTSPAAPAPPVAGTSPSLLSTSPLAPTGAPTTYPYMAYHHRDYTSASSGTGAGAPQDQKAAGAVQVSQSVSAGEHHSTYGGWPSSAPGAPSSSSAATSSSASAAAAALGTGLAPADAAAARKATLKDILAQDCPGAEELGYCDSPPRYPMQQVSEAIERCSELLDHMYAPPPEDREAEGDTEARGRVVQKVSVERCSAPGRACARLADSKCARNLGFRNGARATACDQRTALVPVLTWDPEAPAACPRLKMARFPVACVCRMLQ
ncbi:hypothetical protein FOCC_FOCC001597 [Frankliniella occidentalis]|nr:hypothetical protein FOCC_FOCC001597 [Frankliniella occidentalis]